MIDTKAIRAKVLDLALRGKLTEQRPEDGTAEELYQQIQQKNHSKPIKEKINSEKPFDIPTTWKWVHLNEIADTSLGKTLDKSKNTGELCPYLCSINVHWDGIKLDTVKEARFTEDEKTKYRLDSGDLLICEGGDVGRTAIWNQNTVMYYQNALHRVRFHCNINPWFYRDLFEYYKAIGLLDWFSTGMTIKHLVQSSLYSLWLPLPPLSEQKRIVDKVDSMIAILNTIDTLQSQYQDNLATLKSKIIDAGIQGKLTEQLPEDGTAEELYRQIQAEKAALEKAGKIKKSKPLAPVAEEEKPFEIPESWKWVRFGEIGVFKKGPFGSALTKSMFVPRGEHTIKVYEQQHAIKKDCTLGRYYITQEYFDDHMSGFEVQPGDIIISCAGTIGETYIMPQAMERGIINQALMRVTIVPSIDKRFFQYYFNTYLKRSAQNESNGMAIKNIPPFEVLKNWCFPLPPLAEQKRIVARLEELLTVCEG